MPIFVYRCDCGTTFERLVPRDATAPDCPSCGGDTRKIPAGPSIGRATAGSAAGLASGTAAGDVPMPWKGPVAGGPEGIQREVRLRENIVQKGRQYPGNPGSTATPAASD